MLENVSQDINKKVTFIWDQTGFMPCCLKMYPLRALKSPQKFRTQGCSSANFLIYFRFEDMKPELPDCPDIWWWLFFLAQQLWDKETGKDNHLNSMQESWGKWRIVSKRYFFTLFFCLTQWNARIWWWALQSFFLRKKSLKIDLHVWSCLS